jgi:hypothetical protein
MARIIDNVAIVRWIVEEDSRVNIEEMNDEHNVEEVNSRPLASVPGLSTSFCTAISASARSQPGGSYVCFLRSTEPRESVALICSWRPWITSTGT